MDNGEFTEVPVPEKKLYFPDEVKRTKAFLATGELGDETQPSHFLKPKLAEMQEQRDFGLVRD